MNTPLPFSVHYRMLNLNNRDKFYIRLPPATIFSFPLTSTFYRIQCLRFMSSRSDTSSFSYRMMREIQKSGCDPAQPSLISTISIATKLIKQRYDDHGFTGIYQGFSSMAIHTVIRDLFVFIISKLPSFEISMINDITCPASTENETIKNGLRWIRRNKKQINEITLTILSEIAAYPLLLCTTRLIVYDGNQSLGLWKMLSMTYDYEGFWALYKGIIPHLFCTITTYLTDLANKNSNVNDMDYVDDIMHMALSVSNSHIMQISTIQRCFSPIDGLCTETDLLELIKSISWKGLTIQLLLGSLLVSTKAYSTNLLL